MQSGILCHWRSKNVTRLCLKKFIKPSWGFSQLNLDLIIVSQDNKFELVPRPQSAIEKAEPGAMRILSGMVADTLALAHVGEAEAAFNLGCDYYNGNGVPLDYKLAAKYFRDAAEKSHVAAQDRLGFCYEYGKGVTEDRHEAVRWFRMAAERGYAEAQFNLGWCYESEDPAEALRWYLKAAGQGNVWAQQWLGICYENGQTIVPQDYVEAAKWFRKAAEQGEAHSQYCLAVLLQNGRGVAQDYAEAVRWYHKAVEQGHTKAQNNLGLCFENGHGVEQDLPEAYKFYKLAANDPAADKLLDDDFTPFQGKSATNLERIMARITTAEIAEGERRYREFRANH
jgi:TPR repeat protein